MYNFEKEKIQAYSEGEKAADWFSKLINIDVVLTRSFDLPKSSTHKYELSYKFKESDVRKPGHKHAAVHLINQKSVDHLQSRITKPGLVVTAEQFRPNIIISGVEADDEDDMRECMVKPQNVIMRVVKLCVR